MLEKHTDDYVHNIAGDRDEVFISFGTGNVKCYMTDDSVCLGKLCVNKMLILEAYYESEQPFGCVLFDGIIGLSFTHLSVNPRANFLDMLLKENKIRKKVFSFYFNIDEEKESELHIGGLKDTKYIGDIHYFPVISRSYWEINLKDIYYGDIRLDVCKGRKCSAIVDTGTSLLAAPENLLSTISSHIAINYDCSGVDLLKNIRFELDDGKILSLEPDYYVLVAKSDDELISYGKQKNLQAKQ